MSLRKVVLGGALLLAAGVAARVLVPMLLKPEKVWPSVRFEGPHRLSRPAARASETRLARFDAAVEQARTARKAATAEDLIAIALDETGRALHFGLGHKTRLVFDETEREGNCVEYAHLFATLFNRAAERVGQPARAQVVRSGSVSAFGLRFSSSAWIDHDWTFVLDRPSGRRWLVDPAFADVGLGWNLEGKVKPPLPPVGR